ncbi:hypothetical protein [Marinitoga aeolica]|uniref:HTH merR-type domain-containing protein n=1 Tax=Marinitoga aeolica TaxID=2809031 RepID=A0ABY8PMP0_9BACT|nr:hypothetical protein [Marinitoga aeolica]WGS63902.1 hypothetical protein JRV97_05845 [Marinitoga aeolica]
MGLITIPYFCRKYNFNNPDLLRKLVKHLNIQPVTGDLETRGMRFYKEEDLLKLYNIFHDAFGEFDIGE